MACISSTNTVASPLPNTLPQSRNRLKTKLTCDYYFERKESFPDSVVQIIHDYSATIWPYWGSSNPFPNPINLSNPDVLTTYLGKNFRQPSILNAATTIAGRIYECSNRMISADGGEAYCMAPEVLAYAMQLAKDQLVLEIAGASGEHSVLLACSDSTHVYFNEMDSKENKRFRNLQKDLPPKVKKKLTALEGNCFTLATMRPDLINKIGLIFCQNLIHFFNATQEKDFFDLIKKMLKPGGLAIFTANAVTALMKGQEPPKELSDLTTFQVFQCYISNCEISPAPIACIFHDLIPVDDHTSMDAQVLHLYKRKLKAKWVVDKKAFNGISEPIMKQKIKKAIQEERENLKSIQEGRVSVLISKIRAFSTRNLQACLIKHGLNVESVFNISIMGHIQEDPENALKVGAIVKLP